MGARIAVPLGVLLPCLAVGLAASGAVAGGMALVSGTSGYLTRQVDDDVLGCAASLLSHGLVTAPGSVRVPGQLPPGTCGIELLSASGQVLVPVVAGAAGGPVIPPGRRWPAANLAQPVTVPGAGGGGRWRVVITAVRYQLRRIPYVYGSDDLQYVISGPTGPGLAGMAAVVAGLAGTGQITGQVAAGYAAAAGAVLVLLAGAALAAARAILRPLRQAARFAGTLTKISEQLGASRTAEAAARRPADEMSACLGEVSLELRTSVNVVRGFAQYCRQRGTPPPASLDRMMRRIADEAARMDTLTRRLEAHSARQSTGPDPPRGRGGTGRALAGTVASDVARSSYVVRTRLPAGRCSRWPRWPRRPR
jgi:hypothetical protein